MLTIEQPHTGKYAFLHLGFRPLFSAAIVFAIIGIAIWMGMYLYGWTLPLETYPTITWHAHEMVFGYALAMGGGFLLTAIKNWTGLQTIQGKTLLSLFLLWVIARILPFMLNIVPVYVLAVIDISFNLFLAIAASIPIIQRRRWNDFGLIGKLHLMVIANSIFYLGIMGIWPSGTHIGLYGGFYIILALIFTMGRRVIPFFIEKGVDCPFQPKNWRWLDISSLFLFLAFAISDLINAYSLITAILAGILFAMHCMRLYGWYTHDIWKKPLLWVLYIGYAWIVAGFLLKILSFTLGISSFLAIHAFTYGGIGLITTGMMARVSLGHTGRNVFDPPRILNVVFGILLVGTIVRVILPLFDMGNYAWWIATAQILWITAFVILGFVYLPMLVKARVDGRPG
jgi:uncharacterized protein involved in response to NO